MKGLPNSSIYLNDPLGALETSLTPCLDTIKCDKLLYGWRSLTSSSYAVLTRPKARVRGCLHGSSRKEEDPSTRKILEGETTFRLVYMQKFRPGWLSSGGGKDKKLYAFSSCRSECPAASISLFLFVPSTRIFRAKVVYMVPGSVPSVRIFLSLSSYREEDPIARTKYRLFACKLNRENISMALG